MGKRSNFPRRPQDAYDTPAEAVTPLLPHLKPGTYFVEPCAGAGNLIAHLSQVGHTCVDFCDVEPRRPSIPKFDALEAIFAKRDCFITNPPWSRHILHPLIAHLSNQAPTWLLFDAAWAYTKQARAFKSRCRKIVSVGRVRWIPGTTMTGKDDCAWYLFDKPNPNCVTEFYFPL